MTILALHGFLGEGKDFEPMINGLSSMGLKAEWFCPNFFKPGSKFNLGSLSELASQLNSEFLTVKGPKILFGYSMGGRIALEAFKKAPDQWSKVVLFSTHLGLGDAAAQRDRIRADEVWANRFLNDAWSEVLSDWDAQEVFRGDEIATSSLEIDFDRQRLAQALQNLSVSRQALFSGLDLSSFHSQISFFVGQRDAKFIGQYKLLKEQGIIRDYFEVEDCGHRILNGEHAQLLTYLVDRLNL